VTGRPQTDAGALRGARILLGVSGGIACYKAVEVARLLTKRGARVQVVMTEAATHFVGPITFSSLTKRPAYTGLFEEQDRVLHVRLAREADLVLVAPATANVLAKMANGLADDLLSAVLLTATCPIVVAPAMHTEMWEHAAVQRGVERLRSDGVVLIEPEVGELASGDVGLGRLADPEWIVEEVKASLTPKDLDGLRVLITSGPTREPLDPVRFISNRSSGRMGHALAVEARRRGAEVTVITGPVVTELPPGIDVVPVETTQQLLDESLSRFDDCDVAIMAAAVADWRPADVARSKTKKSEAERNLLLEPTPDIAAEMGRKKGAQLLVAFAAETEDMVKHARDKLVRKNADLIVANLVGRPGTGFDTDTNDAAIVSPESIDRLPRMTKAELARRIVDRAAELTRPRGRSDRLD